MDYEEVRSTSESLNFNKSSEKIKALRGAIINFVVGGSIRQVQDKSDNLRSFGYQKYSFIVHTEQKKESHSWQSDIVNSILQQLSDECERDSQFSLEDKYQNGHAFWWPVLFMPNNLETVIFSSKEADEDKIQ